jgi:hypothetical protein
MYLGLLACGSGGRRNAGAGRHEASAHLGSDLCVTIAEPVEQPQDLLAVEPRERVGARGTRLPCHGWPSGSAATIGAVSVTHDSPLS